MYAKLGNMSKDDQELWHSNGDELSLSYEAGLTQTQLEDKLKSASKTGNKETTVRAGMLGTTRNIRQTSGPQFL